MVWSVVQNFRQGLKYRGGWWGLVLHMYTVRIDGETNELTRAKDVVVEYRN
jgi:hypothetical protein